VDDRGEDENRGELEIADLGLWNLLKQLLSRYSYHLFHGSPSTINSPYEMIILNWDELQQAASETAKDDTDRQARSDLRLLLDTISTSSGDIRLDSYLKNRQALTQQQSVTFDNLWTIFVPGTLVYGKPFQGRDQVFVVQDNTTPRISWSEDSRGMEERFWVLLAWTYDWDGKKFKRSSLRLEFEEFVGARPITALPYYPLKYHDRFNDLKQELIERGKKFRAVCTTDADSRLYDYKGNALLVKEGLPGMRKLKDKEDSFLSFLSTLGAYKRGPPQRTTDVDSQVMIDFEAYLEKGPLVAQVGSIWPDDENPPQCSCNECQDNTLLNERFRARYNEEKFQQGDWEEEQYMLCPPRVLGFALRERQWAQLDLLNLTRLPTKNPDDAWSTRLRLADGDRTKDMIRDLVLGHGKLDSPDDSRLEVDDIVAKKGKGLVILLYGKLIQVSFEFRN
jgi:hypothetical protein